MPLRYESFPLDVLLPFAIWFVIVTIPLLLPYAIFLQNHRRTLFRFSPLLHLVIWSAYWILATFISIAIFAFPPHYADAIRHIDGYSHSWVYDQALVLAVPAFKLTFCSFAGIRIGRSVAGQIAAGFTLLIVGFFIGLTAYFTWHSLLLRSPLDREMLTYIFDGAAYVCLFLIIAGLDVIYFGIRRIHVGDVHQNRTFAYAVLSILVLAWPLLGFLILPWWGGILWLLFLLVCLPVLIAFFFAAFGSERFSIRVILQMYRHSILWMLRLLSGRNKRK